jgi:hypothetical protein
MEASNAARGAVPSPGPNWRRIVIGAIVALVALGVSAYGMNHAAQYGGTAYIWWGAVLWGGWRVLTGFIGE